MYQMTSFEVVKNRPLKCTLFIKWLRPSADPCKQKEVTISLYNRFKNINYKIDD